MQTTQTQAKSSKPLSSSVRAHVRGLNIDAKCGKGGVVNLVVRAQQQHKGIWGRIRQHFANALFRAGDACHPSQDNQALRVVLSHVIAAPVNDGLPDLANPNVRNVYPLHTTNGDAHYIALLVHEGVKRHQDGRRIASNNRFLWWKKGTDDVHRVAPSGQSSNVTGQATTAATRYLTVLLIALGMSSAYLLDGPSEIEASQAVAADLQDAIVTAKAAQ